MLPSLDVRCISVGNSAMAGLFKEAILVIACCGLGDGFRMSCIYVGGVLLV